jgi:hypothetical protein
MDVGEGVTVVDGVGEGVMDVGEGVTVVDGVGVGVMDVDEGVTVVDGVGVGVMDVGEGVTVVDGVGVMDVGVSEVGTPDEHCPPAVKSHLQSKPVSPRIVPTVRRYDEYCVAPSIMYASVVWALLVPTRLMP